MLRKPTVASAVGLAACVVVAFTVLFPTNGNPSVEAAVIMQRLNEQIDETTLFEMRVERIRVGETTLAGTLAVSANEYVADVELGFREDEPYAAAHAKVKLAIDGDSGWLLIERIGMDNPLGQQIVEAYFPAGAPTLVTLDGEGLTEVESELAGEPVALLRSGRLAEGLSRLVYASPDLGGTVEELDDGNVVLTLPMEDAEALEAIEDALADILPPQSRRIVVLESEGCVIQMDAGTLVVNGEQLEIDENTLLDPEALKVLQASGFVARAGEQQVNRVEENPELIGSTLKVVYDPATEQVRSFAVDNYGPGQAGIAVNICQGQIAPWRLDASRVTTPETRTMTWAELEAIFESMEERFDVVD
jgi:hypothetical protein